MDKKREKTCEGLLELSLTKLKEILESPHATKVNLMQIDGKLIINFLNFYKGIRQAESGKEMVRAGIAKMVCESKEEIVDFFKVNLPEIVVSSKRLKE